MKKSIGLLKMISAIAFVLILVISPLDLIAFAARAEDTTHTFAFQGECENPLYYDSGPIEEIVSGGTTGFEISAKKFDSTPVQENDMYRAAENIRDNLKARKTNISVKLNSNRTDFSALVSETFRLAISDDLANNPDEGDYIAWQYGGYKYTGYATQSPNGYEYNLNFYVTYYTTAQEEAKVSALVGEALSDMKIDSLTEYEKVKNIYDYVCKVCNYDYSTLVMNDNKRFSAYGALVQGKAVCQGYSLLLYRMLEEAGIDSRIITSTSHSWNIAKIDGLYYNLDVTWDDPAYDSGKAYKYFLRCDSHFSGHEREPQYETVNFVSKYAMHNQCYSNATVNETRCSAPCAEHDFVVVKTVAATCTTAGYKLQKCKHCDVENRTDIKATGHKIVKDKAVPATLAAEGKTEGSHCSVCKKVIVAQKAVKKLTVANASITSINAKSKGFKLGWKKQSDVTGYQIQYSTSNKFEDKKTTSVSINKNATVSKEFTKLTGNKKYYIRLRAYKVYNGKKYYSSWSIVKNVTTKK